MTHLSFGKDFVYSFIPIFVAMDVPGLVPLFLSLTKGLSEEERHVVIWQAVLTGFIVSVAFIAVGRFIFNILGISVSDFEMAGGLLLLVLSIVEMLNLGDRERLPSAQAGPVPLGTPIMVGPAVLTSLIILIGLRGYLVTLLALVANLMIVVGVLHQSRYVVRWMGDTGLRVLSQVISLFLAAIAVSMIRRGFITFH